MRWLYIQLVYTSNYTTFNYQWKLIDIAAWQFWVDDVYYLDCILTRASLYCRMVHVCKMLVIFPILATPIRHRLPPPSPPAANMGAMTSFATFLHVLQHCAVDGCVRIGVCYLLLALYFLTTPILTTLMDGDCMGNLGINVTLLAGCESRGSRYNYKVYNMLNII